jgi:hypothetical protein
MGFRARHVSSAASGGTTELRIAGNNSIEILFETFDVATSPIVHVSISVTHPRQ